MPSVLTPATTNVVVSSLPFFLGIVFVKTFIFFCHIQVFYADVFISSYYYLCRPYGHQTVLFKEDIKSRWISVLCFFSGNGVYHYLHHSRDADIVASNTTNQVNIAGGIGYFGDHVFGTFKGLPFTEEPIPKVGLWNNPVLHHNPLRLVLSGLMQIIYEVYLNKGVITKLRCLLGSVNYKPPITRSFHISQKAVMYKEEDACENRFNLES